VNVDLAPGHDLLAGARIRVRIVAATPHSLLGEPLDLALSGLRQKGDRTGSGQKSGPRQADEPGRVADVAGTAGDALRVL
jgi:hypothetical protein